MYIPTEIYNQDKVDITKDTKNTIYTFDILQLVLFETRHYVPVYGCPFVQLPIFRR